MPLSPAKRKMFCNHMLWISPGLRLPETEFIHRRCQNTNSYAFSYRGFKQASTGVFQLKQLLIIENQTYPQNKTPFSIIIFL